MAENWKVVASGDGWHYEALDTGVSIRLRYTGGLKAPPWVRRVEELHVPYEAVQAMVELIRERPQIPAL